MRRTGLMTTVRCFFFTMAMLALCIRAAAADAGPAKLLDFTKGDKPDAKAQTYYVLKPGGECRGIPNNGLDTATQMYVSRVPKGQEHGLLQVGDVILGADGTLFDSDVIDTWHEILATAVASKVAQAEEMASEDALKNPRLQQILEELSQNDINNVDDHGH